MNVKATKRKGMVPESEIEPFHKTAGPCVCVQSSTDLPVQSVVLNKILQLSCNKIMELHNLSKLLGWPLGGPNLPGWKVDSQIRNDATGKPFPQRKQHALMPKQQMTRVQSELAM